MTITVDRRTIPCEPDPEGLERVRKGAKRLITIEIELAKDLHRVWANRAFAHEGAASIEEYGRRCNLSARRTRLLLHLGLGMSMNPSLEKAVRDASITVEKAGYIGRIAHRLGTEDAETDWIDKAKTMTLPDFVRVVERRIAELDQQDEKLIEYTLYLSHDVKESLHRARVVASRKKRSALSREQTIEILAGHWLDDFDPLRSPVGRGTRRTPPGGGDRSSRYVPAEVVRMLRDRHGDRCCVPGCRNEIFVDKAHVKPKREGGDQEIENELPLCTMHHTLFDAGILVLVGWTADSRPIFRAPGGKILHPDEPVSVERSELPP